MHSFEGYRVEELFDPVQTHAVYSVPYAQVPAIKAALKEKLGATRFRTVQPTMKGVKVICFKLN